ncbi:acetoacetate--CoA ligase [Sphingobacterium sp. SRCM116780]|uniref:acetoacetate--CoA ligase n=1 Tax=Sphingobacterium sp. SRCM116780 TaxID=2907623 RepID=UPI001F1AC9FA|nr:acetoacetate--CoA ligase [Sphingobacterium sp. SRCM116780]UIR57937.1 acetoacetate--CoA ligase [Sphingobacterium sp. SRCM116780]
MSNLIWQPSVHYKQESSLTQFKHFVEQKRHKKMDSYPALWEWSISELAEFWEDISQFFDLKLHTPYHQVLAASAQGFIGSKWFDGATLNYAEHIFRKASTDRPAILFQEENKPLRTCSWKELEDMVISLQHHLLEYGVEKGDRIVAVLRNSPEAIALFLAVNSIGAIWSCCSPDFGEASIVERFSQVKPKLLFADAIYSYNGKLFDIKSSMLSLASKLDTLVDDVIFIDEQKWTDMLSFSTSAPLTFTAVPFDHPIWILYSSGTTGKPKAITHSNGGNLIEHFKALALHQNVQEEERFVWYATTGWMMWNYALSSLLIGATLCIYEGAMVYPEKLSFWDFVEQNKIDHVGAGAAYYIANQHLTLDQPRFQPKTIGSTGSPLPPQTFEWLQKQFPSSQIVSLSGGTDVCSAFLSGNPLLPVYAGEIQCLTLGSKIAAYNENGESVKNEVGELVIELPMPSMPLYFWNDHDNRQYQASYFEKYPGLWCHGDWIKFTEHDGIVVYGRSDATLNRGGVRIGTAEIYNVLNTFEEVEDSLIICLDHEDGTSKMPLYVQMKPGVELSDDLQAQIKLKLRKSYSPRHVPDEIVAVPAIPYTMSGKKLEIPVKKIMMGTPVEKAVSLDVLKDPKSLDFWIHMQMNNK